jgi:hypothetical protein
VISRDTKSPDSTSDIVSAAALAARELLKLFPAKTGRRFPKTDRHRAVFVC